MSERMMVCENAGKCGSDNCFHHKPHIEDTSCAFGCMSHPGYEDLRCLPLTTEIEQPHKPTRKRSAPLYKELLDQNKRLEIEKHSLKITVDILKNAPLFGVLLWWFRNRKGGGK